MGRHFHVELTEDQQLVVNAERDSHPEPHVRRKMLALWAMHCGATHEGVRIGNW